MRRIFSIVCYVLLLGMVSEQMVTAAPHKKHHNRTYKRHNTKSTRR
jgi:hypothetical protein